MLAPQIIQDQNEDDLEQIRLEHERLVKELQESQSLDRLSADYEAWAAMIRRERLELYQIR